MRGQYNLAGIGEVVGSAVDVTYKSWVSRHGVSSPQLELGWETNGGAESPLPTWQGQVMPLYPLSPGEN